MSQLHIDTNALVKRYTLEIGSNWLKTLLGQSQGHNVIISEITLPEFAAALAAKGRGGNILSIDQTKALALFLNHCATEYELVGVSRTIIDRAVNLTQKYRLRGYDAVQLASALVTRETLIAANILNNFTMVTADQDLLNAGQLEGLLIENPNLHP